MNTLPPALAREAPSATPGSVRAFWLIEANSSQVRAGDSEAGSARRLLPPVSGSVTPPSVRSLDSLSLPAEFSSTTTTFTATVAVSKFPTSTGVKVTAWLVVPTSGTFVGSSNAKTPAVLALPPLNLDSARVWPSVISEASGEVMIAGVALLTTLAVTGKLTVGAVPLVSVTAPV